MKLLTKITIIFLLILSIFILACTNNNRNPSNEVDEKYYCENEYDCVDGEYCEVTEPGGCVGAEWWWKNVGNRFDCLPDPSLCECINNRCVKK